MLNMPRYVAYPAILDDSDNPKDYFTVTFPDLPGVISEGDGIAAAMSKASEALGLALYDAKNFPVSSRLNQIKQKHPDKIVVLIAADLVKTKKEVKPPTVKKNTTIPRSLAQKAEQSGINFSKTLTEALEIKLSKLAK
ncbi:MAG: type II toxin-antitoxin system HicB family antitoxin [Lactobacillus sp.]|nr:type II toxin-antitoxin system HicB family antitoxin [Lactobacillus sp.]MCI1303540.1 type II toxin-antitoxin system HicB family antitoxin [Lactobacillus sp.]MCI1329716.1 type II toxin-antitoxin system HicB family antitoxin [Lactobacillus sp.]MCI1399316.1 type II toxin-antitoxin system HicB family antitoxin [Lactobacillus sp.]MCI1466133.1 type II toxin-antitoxin system HicB family antitoxin [Lactobacillus sp.]